MGFSVNKITLLGTLGKDIELSSTTSGLEIGKFSVATSHSVKKNESYEEVTTWHNCTIFKPSDFLKSRLTKGSKIYLEGRQDHQSFETDGVKKYFSSVIVEPFTVIPLDKRDPNAVHNDYEKPATDSKPANDDELDSLPF